MPQTSDLGRLFVHRQHIDPQAPRVHPSTTREIEWPYRTGRSLVFRHNGFHALVVGWWSSTLRRAAKADLSNDEIERRLVVALDGRPDVAQTEIVAEWPHYNEEHDDSPA